MGDGRIIQTNRVGLPSWLWWALLALGGGGIALFVVRWWRRRARSPNPYMASEVNRRTADGGRLFSFRGVITGLLVTAALPAAPGTFG
jgi:hypothetical protein